MRKFLLSELQIIHLEWGDFTLSEQNSNHEDINERESDTSDEEKDEDQFNSEGDTPDKEKNEDKFTPNDDTSDEEKDEKKFDPNVDPSDEEKDEKKFDPNVDPSDEEKDEKKFDPNVDPSDEEKDEKKFDPNVDPSDEEKDEKKFNPNVDPSDEEKDEKKFDLNVDPSDEEKDEKKFDPNVDPSDEEKDKDKFNPNVDTPDEEKDGFKPNVDTPDKEKDNPNIDTPDEFNGASPKEISNKSKEGTQTLLIPKNSSPEQEPTYEIDSNESPEDLEIDPEENELIGPEGEPIYPYESLEVLNIRAELEEMGLPADLEEEKGELDQDHEQNPESIPDQNPDSEPELGELKENEFDTGEFEPIPYQVSQELIRLEVLIEKLYDQQENPEETTENEPEKDPDSISNQKLEVEPDQNLDQKPEEVLEGIDPEKGDQISPLEDSVILAEELNDKIFNGQKSEIRETRDEIEQESEINPNQESENKSESEINQKSIKNKSSDREILEQNSSKITEGELEIELEQLPEHEPNRELYRKEKHKSKRRKKLELITNPEELGDFKNYEYKIHKIEKQASRSEKNEPKQATKKKRKKSLITEGKELEKSDKELLISNSKEFNSASQKQKILLPKTSNKAQKRPMSKQIQKPKENLDGKSKKLEPTETQIKVVNIQARQELMNKYRQETGKRPIYNKKETKGFKIWLEKQNELVLKKSKSAKKSESRGEWEILLEKWINEFDEKELSQVIKKELINIVRKYRKFRVIYKKIIQLVQKVNLTKKESYEIEDLLKILDKISTKQEKIFRNLRSFQGFYNENIIWNKSLIMANREKFIKHLAQKLKDLKKIERNNISVKKYWKEILKENLYKSTTLSLNEKSRINRIIQKGNLKKEDIKELISILSKLPTEVLISLLGNNFKLHTKLATGLVPLIAPLVGFSTYGMVKLKEGRGCYFEYKGQKYNRHIYSIISNYLSYKELKCEQCGESIRLSNLQATENIFNKDFNIVKLKLLEQKKGPNDQAIYRIRFKKDEKGNYLDFPGFIYLGKSIQQVKAEIKKKYWGWHGRLGEYLDKFDFKTFDEFWSSFDYEILQLIRYDGNEVSMSKKVDSAEKFWIAWHKSQFFSTELITISGVERTGVGLNIQEGGSDYIKPRDLIPLHKIEDAFDELIYKYGMFYGNQGPRIKLLEILGTDRATLEPNLKWHYGTTSAMDILQDRVSEEVKYLFELGFSLTQIRDILPLDFGKATRLVTPLTKMIKRKYKDEIPNIDTLRINKIRDIIMKEIITQKVREGYYTLASLLVVLPGFKKDAPSYRVNPTGSIALFIRTNMGGYNRLIEDNRQYIMNHIFAAAKNLIIQNKDTHRYGASNILTDLINSGIIKEYSITTIARNGPEYFRRVFRMEFEEFKQLSLTGKLS